MKHWILALLIMGWVPAAIAAGPEVTIADQPIEVKIVNPQIEVTAEITNDPLLVEVINPTPVSAPARFQLVGFTTAVYDGDLGGVFGFTSKCQLEFPNSRWCDMTEVIATTSIPTGLTGKAWMGTQRETTQLEGCGSPAWTANDSDLICNDGKPHNDSHECALEVRNNPNNCLARTGKLCIDGCCPPKFKKSKQTGNTVNAEGHFNQNIISNLDQACFQFFPLACCALVP